MMFGKLALDESDPIQAGFTPTVNVTPSNRQCNSDRQVMRWRNVCRRKQIRSEMLRTPAPPTFTFHHLKIYLSLLVHYDSADPFPRKSSYEKRSGINNCHTGMNFKKLVRYFPGSTDSRTRAWNHTRHENGAEQEILPAVWKANVSCGGRYMAYNICVSSLCCKDGESNYFCHQLVKISVPKTDMNLSGPAFIEVENQSGLSNFIPIFVGDKETSEEMEILQQKFLYPPQNNQCRLQGLRVKSWPQDKHDS